MRRLLGLCGAILLTAPAGAHPPPRATHREIVRLTGHVAATPADDATLVLMVLGREYPFVVGDFRVLSYGEAEPERPAGRRFVLQGPRELLSRIGAARPEQWIGILADRRAGATELFLLAVDLCREK